MLKPIFKKTVVKETFKKLGRLLGRTLTAPDANTNKTKTAFALLQNELANVRMLTHSTGIKHYTCLTF